MIVTSVSSPTAGVTVKHQMKLLRKMRRVEQGSAATEVAL